MLKRLSAGVHKYKHTQASWAVEAVNIGERLILPCFFIYWPVSTGNNNGWCVFRVVYEEEGGVQLEDSKPADG